MLREETWNAFRQQMPITEKWAYLDHAAVAPISRPALQMLTRWAQDVAENGDTNSGTWVRQLETARIRAATLLGAENDEVALIRNTTEGVTLIAEGFPWRPGDNVVTPAGEFPTNYYPWRNLRERHVDVRLVPAEEGRCRLGQLEAACDAKTRIIAVSWVGYATGWRNDLDALADIAHRNGAFLFIDAIQALGAFPIDVKRTPVDFLAADGHKWLLGPEGAGIFYVRKEHLNLLRPIGVSWNSVRHSGDFTNLAFDLKPSAGRYEGGSYNVAGLLALGESLQLLLQTGVPAIAERILHVTELLCERLAQLGAVIVSDRKQEHASGIVAFELPGQDPLSVKRHCRKKGVVVNCRAGRLRASPHAYNNADDINRLADALAE